MLHVQGVSHWAPANIGPYSQGVLSANQLHVSGQIGSKPNQTSESEFAGLVPGSMDLATGEAAQASLGLRHVDRVAKAMMPSISFNDVKRVICYVVGEEGARQADLKLRAVDSSLSGLVTYFRVNQLPRGALVEWEIEYHQVLP